MKKILIISFIVILLLSVNLVSANGDHESEIEEGRNLVKSNVSCDNLSDEQLEAIGEYLMEQMHPNESHDAMHEMMGIEEGTEYHEQFHVNIAKMMYCGEGGMMGSGGMMGMMPMMMNMMGANMMNSGVTGGQTPIQTNMMQGMMGNWGYGLWYWSFLNILYVILLVGLIILVYLGIIKFGRNLSKKK
jgi:hypothetical protein